MTTDATDPRVDAYLDAAPDWQREIMQLVRDLLHEADPEIEETIKRTVQPYFVLTTRPAAATTGPPPKPPKTTPRPDPGPTDAPHPTWTPAPTFTSLVKFVDYCYSAGDGTEQVFAWIEWNSPVRVTEVWLWIDGQLKGITWFASGSGIGGEYESRHSTTYSFEVGTTHTFSARFKSGDDWVTGQTESAPYTVQQGDPCPTG